jgi:hypothetical protein
MGLVTLWAGFFANSSGHPVHGLNADSSNRHLLAEDPDLAPVQLGVVDRGHGVPVIATEEARLADLETTVGGKIKLRKVLNA